MIQYIWHGLFTQVYIQFETETNMDEIIYFLISPRHGTKCHITPKEALGARLAESTEWKTSLESIFSIQSFPAHR